MALTEVVFGAPRLGRIGLVQMDAMVNEVHSKANDITEHPVEVGTNISDHIRRRPERITVRGIVSNTPIVIGASFRAPSPIVDDLTFTSERAELAYAQLSLTMDAGELVEVITTFKEYSNMAIESLVVERDARRGNIAEMVIELREVIIAVTQQVVVQAQANPASDLRNDGVRPTTPATGGVAEKAAADSSFLTGLFGAFGG